MASTRNRNTITDYNLEKNLNNNYLEHNLYINSSYGRPTSECIPELYNPSKLSRDLLSSNSIDIESTLKGIGSSNLVTANKPIQPNIKFINFKPWFDRPKNVIMPHPLIFDNNQRPFLD